MKFSDLKFDGPNNACLSLRILAELVRVGEVKVREAGFDEHPWPGDENTLTLRFTQRGL